MTLRSDADVMRSVRAAVDPNGSLAQQFNESNDSALDGRASGHEAQLSDNSALLNVNGGTLMSGCAEKNVASSRG